MRWMLSGCALAACAVVMGNARPAQAFCGFYVSGADAQLFNNATQVVLMREGTRTVLSMQNNYQGPTKDFAMVVPVPVVLQEENVVTLAKAMFTRVDQLSAPRLVEYWEQDPCRPSYDDAMPRGSGVAMAAPKKAKAESAADLGVTIEAQFEVGEYQIVILSAKDSTGLDTWLRQEGYKIPDGAEPYLRPYVDGGWKFFVAKVDIEKVKFENGQAMLSPLRFHYDSDEFRLPIRLGLMNSAGTQDLIVHILAPGKRFQVSNYENVTIPTNLDVKNEARERFGEFYAALFDRTLEKNPRAVVTEYAWDASSCDPCPTPALSWNELATLGLDVLYTPISKRPRKPDKQKSSSIADEKKGDAVDDLIAPKSRRPSAPVRPPRMPRQQFVLTRLHARYGKDNLGEDLVFAQADPIVGGREFRSGPGGTLEEGAKPASMNNFQARYAIRHEWDGPIACANPVRGMWGGPPPGQKPPATQAARDLAFVPRGRAQLAMMVKQDVPELDVKAGVAEPTTPATDPGNAKDPGTGKTGDEPANQGKQETRKRDGGCSIARDPTGATAGLVVLLALALAGARRRRP